MHSNLLSVEKLRSAEATLIGREAIICNKLCTLGKIIALQLSIDNKAS
jgi:hypothetical protein